MIRRSGIACLLALAFSMAPSRVDAAIARFHYVANEPGGMMTLVPSPIYGSAGERITITGTCPYDPAPRPTHTVTLRHTFTGQCVVVPLRLPQGTPNIMHRSNRIMYNYGSFNVEVRFIADGSVDVQYNSGLFREIDPQ